MYKDFKLIFKILRCTTAAFKCSNKSSNLKHNQDISLLPVFKFPLSNVETISYACQQCLGKKWGRLRLASFIDRCQTM
jgi:hypothetical protein